MTAEQEDLKRHIFQMLVANHPRKVAVVSSWPARQRLIDSVLSRMEAEGLVEGHETSSGNTARRVYCLTDVGRSVRTETL